MRGGRRDSVDCGISWSYPMPMINPFRIVVDWLERSEQREIQVQNELEEMRELGVLDGNKKAPSKLRTGRG